VLQVPRLFVGGRYVGGEPEIRRLHGSGELANILRDAGVIVTATSAADLPSSAAASPSDSSVVVDSADNNATPLSVAGVA